MHRSPWVRSPWVARALAFVHAFAAAFSSAAAAAADGGRALGSCAGYDRADLQNQEDQAAFVPSLAACTVAADRGAFAAGG
jgi:hypothetical protein